ncbi:MAG: alpha-amylase family glycosyl hydrolase [Mucilaginibacter sp.]
MKSIYLLSFVLLIAACSKSKTTPPVTTTVTTTTTTTAVQYGTPFSGVPDTKNVVMYEVNIGSFSQPGNLAGIAARLDSIKALGVNVIWLMPTYPVGVLKSFGSPYCVQDYLKVNSKFGSLDDLRSLVSQAHSKGISVILDWVADHTSWDNPWIANKSWYKQDASGNIISPPNTTYTDVAALNYNSTDMRKAMISAMKYWVLTANVDGYRCDYADAVPDDFWAQAIDTLKTTNHKLVLLAEGSNTAHFNAGFQLIFGWSYLSALRSVFGGAQANAATIGTTNTSDAATVPSGDALLRMTSDHDEDSNGNTPFTAFNGKAGSMAAFTLAATMGGAPLIYSGQEVGISVSQSVTKGVPIDWTANPDMLGAYKKLITFRNNSNALKTGAVTLFSDANVSAFEKVSGTETVLVIVNTRNSVINYAIPAALANTAWTDALNGGTNSLATQVSLQPYEYLVLKK